jgi:Acetyltransferase (GNAT) domain
LEVEVLGEEHYGAWDDFVAGQEHTGSIYSTAQFLDILCRAAGCSFSVAVIRDGDSFVAGLALYRRRAHGHEVISQRWLLYYNGPVLLDALLTATVSHSRGFQVLDALCRFLGRQKVAGVTLHCRAGNQDFRPFLNRGWRVSPAYTIVVPTADSGQLWNRFDRNARRLVRRAEASGCTAEADGDFDSFFSAHEEIHRIKGAPLYLPKGPFRRFFDDLAVAGLGAIFTARLASGVPAASQLVLLGKHRCSHTVCAGSHRAHLSSGAGYLLRWRAFVELGTRGYSSNDLTDASYGDVTRFKAQLGGTLTMTMSLRSRHTLSYRSISRGRAWLRAVRSRLLP